MKPALYVLAGAILSAALILAIVTRYSDKATPQGMLYLTDHWTGRVWWCSPGRACMEGAQK